MNLFQQNMRNYITLILLFVSSLSFGQELNSIEVTTMTLNDFFEQNNIKDYTALFIYQNGENLSCSDGAEMGITIKNGNKLVVFAPNEFSDKYTMTFNDAQNNEHPISTNISVTPRNINCYDLKQKLLFAYKL